ncbi:Caskin/Ankyrin repeat-containing protein [Dioscorea alata]|uniref:Caskin/Ankyrin repeat-containing protein n=1 Tax=Dioscorea alata TaxID=55571 RepID=A0ACB7WQ10_DIOAL|nr:Caskin/Ankyrin repeat-containing protein [Dioscorea alata]
MQREIKWFERVKDLLPEDLVISRNAEGKTAHELFIENHEEMVKSGRDQLMEIGKTCSGLLAAVVFTTSFTAPGGNDSDSCSTGSSKNNMTNTGGNHLVGFKLLAHAYTIGLSLATCSLILFLSFLGSSYRTEAFRNLLPTKYILAGVSFVFSLLAFMVAFICNVYLSIYRGGTSKAMNLIPLILELTGFPFLCVVTLFIGGFGLKFSSSILKVFHR